jgi:hypothetical protein
MYRLWNICMPMMPVIERNSIAGQQIAHNRRDRNRAGLEKQMDSDLPAFDTLANYMVQCSRSADVTTINMRKVKIISRTPSPLLRSL